MKLYTFTKRFVQIFRQNICFFKKYISTKFVCLASLLIRKFCVFALRVWRYVKLPAAATCERTRLPCTSWRRYEAIGQTLPTCLRGYLRVNYTTVTAIRSFKTFGRVQIRLVGRHFGVSASNANSKDRTTMCRSSATFVSSSAYSPPFFCIALCSISFSPENRAAYTLRFIRPSEWSRSPSFSMRRGNERSRDAK